jgi:hypothetical protein
MQRGKKMIKKKNYMLTTLAIALLFSFATSSAFAQSRTYQGESIVGDGNNSFDVLEAARRKQQDLAREAARYAQAQQDRLCHEERQRAKQLLEQDISKAEAQLEFVDDKRRSEQFRLVSALQLYQNSPYNERYIDFYLERFRILDASEAVLSNYLQKVYSLRDELLRPSSCSVNAVKEIVAQSNSLANEVTTQLDRLDKEFLSLKF